MHTFALLLVFALFLGVHSGPSTVRPPNPPAPARTNGSASGEQRPELSNVLLPTTFNSRYTGNPKVPAPGAPQTPAQAPAPAPARTPLKPPPYRNREEYLQRNYNWIRCRRLHAPRFDVGGGWIDDNGKRLIKGLKKYAPQCVPINQKVDYLNGQGWGDAVLRFDCFFPYANLRVLLKAIEKVGDKYAMDHRREFYFFNCPGFHEMPYSGAEAKKKGG